MARYDKTPFSNLECIELLKERGLIIENNDRVLKYLDTIGYYRLTGYMYHLQDKKNDSKFKVDTTFSNIIDLYKFDKALRAIVLEYIERIEICLKSKISNKYSLKYGFFWYLDSKLFADYTVFESIKKEIDDTFKNPQEVFLKRFKSNYVDETFPPSNMALEILTFGKTSKLYKGLADIDLKKEIAKEFGQASSTLASWFVYINNIRNLCAHHSRLWNKKVTADRPIIPNRDIYKFNGSVPEGEDFNTTFYCIVSIMHRLLKSFNPDNTFTSKITNLIKTYNIDVELMGFPEDWETNATWHH
ncbi:Abi family protein [Chryseobacterium flavum]|uniref:Abi family protein n=1 Tax=Chryseobacterium flavum TaxID=415851 RepID=UPI002FD8A070